GRRAHQRARRLRPRPGAQPAAGPAHQPRARPGVHLARHPDRALPGRPDRRHVPGPGGRGGPGGRRVRPGAAPVHAGAVLGHAQPAARHRADRAHRPGPVGHPPPVRLPVPHPLLEGDRGVRARVPRRHRGRFACLALRPSRDPPGITREESALSPRKPRFSGVIPPVVTPLTPDGDIDAASLERLVEFLIGAGVSGLFALGSSGETAFLTDARRDEALQVVVRTAAGRVPVLAGCIETTTGRVIERAEIAAKLGADAVVVTAPFYARIHPVEVDRHFRAVKAAVDLPLLAYDVPVSVHTKLTTDLVLSLAADGVVAGIKDSSGDDVGF